MTPYTILLGIISLAICFLPFYLAYRNQKETENILKSAIHDMAQKNNCQFSHLSLNSNLSIGLSSDERFLFFFRKNFLSEDDENEFRTIIALSQFEKCKSEVKMRDNKSQKDPYATIEKMSLIFSPLENTGSIVRLDFYDLSNHFMPNGELKLLKEWELRLKPILEKNRPQVKLRQMGRILKKAG